MNDILKATAQAIVNPVNTVGVAGKGLALQFKIAYPENYIAYLEQCRLGWPVGRVMVFPINGGRFIVNFPTKIHWRDPSNLAYIRAGLNDLRRKIDTYEIQSIAIPKIGCGLGGLRWQDVKPMIIQIINNTVLHIYE